jgi:Putative restriction endonuclease
MSKENLEMARRTTAARGATVMPVAAEKKRIAYNGELPAVRARILEDSSAVEIHDAEAAREFIRSRQAWDTDKYDEVWEGVYVVPPIARNPHQSLVGGLSAFLFNMIQTEGKGTVLPGANVSDRRENWEHNYRCPDVVVVLKDSQAVDCSTHWFGGPDFLVEVLSPGDVSEKKIPFYAQIKVRELLIIHPETREMKLYRHDGTDLLLTEPSDFQGGRWLVSQVIPIALRRKLVKKIPRTELCRTDGKLESWTV